MFKIVSSMGLFGSLSTTITGISTAFTSFVKRPFITYQQENPIKAIFIGTAVFVKDSLYVISDSFGSIYSSVKNGVNVILAPGEKSQVADIMVDRDLFEDDIESA